MASLSPEVATMPKSVNGFPANWKKDEPSTEIIACPNSTQSTATNASAPKDIIIIEMAPFSRTRPP